MTRRRAAKTKSFRRGSRITIFLVCVHNRRLNSAECFMIEGARGDDVWRRRAGVDSGVALISRHCVTATAAAAADQQEAEKSSFIDPPSHFPLSLSS